MNIFRVGVATNYNITKPNLNYKTKDVNSINALLLLFCYCRAKRGIDSKDENS